jgi:hypothetical protein
VWIIYLVTDSTLLAWIAFADLILVAILGLVMVTQWTKDGRAAMAAAAQSTAGGTYRWCRSCRRGCGRRGRSC